MLIKRRTAKFEPEKFVDGYEVALKELVEAKIANAPAPHDEAVAPQRGKVINLMDALRKSIGSETAETEVAGKKKPPVKHGAATAPAKGIELVKPAAKAAAKTAKRKSA